jgi:cytochrome P450
MLRAADLACPTRATAAATLRYTSPSQYQGRVTTRDVTWYGRTVPRGARILLLTGSAGHERVPFAVA